MNTAEALSQLSERTAEVTRITATLLREAGNAVERVRLSDAQAAGIERRIADLTAMGKKHEESTEAIRLKTQQTIIRLEQDLEKAMRDFRDREARHADDVVRFKRTTEAEFAGIRADLEREVAGLKSERDTLAKDVADLKQAKASLLAQFK